MSITFIDCVYVGLKIAPFYRAIALTFNIEVTSTLKLTLTGTLFLALTLAVCIPVDVNVNLAPNIFAGCVNINPVPNVHRIL